MTPDEFRRHGHDLVDWIADRLSTTDRHPVMPPLAPGDVRARLPEHPPDLPEPWADVMSDLDEIIVPGLTQWQHPGFFAWFPSNISYPSILGELAAAGLGVNAMAWATSPAATELETLMLDWMQELLGLPERFRSTSETGGGSIQGTASEATLVAILAARWRATRGAVNDDGDTTRLVGYSTAQAHSSIEKGFRIAGIGRGRLRHVPVDEHHAMRPDALAEVMRADVEAGLTPCIVVTAHGTTSTMAFDPTAAVADVCDEYGAWLHVDAAMSGIAALVPEFRWVNDGLDRADSYTTNPHKWMGINFDCNLFWVADREPLIAALSIMPPYLVSEAARAGAAIDYRDWTIPLGRRFRALKLWFMLRADGVGPTQAMLRDHVAWTQELATLVDADERFEIVAPHPLNLLCVARTGSDLAAANAATDALIDRANAGGDALYTRTEVDDRSVLRISIGATATTREHVLGAWRDLQRLAAEEIV